MIDIHLKHNNICKNGIFNVLICINNHIISCVYCMLSGHNKQVRGKLKSDIGCTLLGDLGVSMLVNHTYSPLSDFSSHILDLP